jgi:transposase-like protein
MPWQESSTMSLRLEFVRLASQNEVSFAELCRRFGVSRQTGYTWLSRVEADGAFDPQDRSRRPYASPRKTSDAVERAVLELPQSSDLGRP